MSANGTMTMHKEMEDMRNETQYRTTCLSGWIAGSHDIKHDNLYLYKEGQLNTENAEHEMWPLFGANDRSERVKKKSCSLEFQTFVTTTHISFSMVMIPYSLPRKQGCIHFT
jgi:hypothetical protein